MGEIVHLGRKALTVELAPGPLEEIRCCGSVSGLRVIIARQPQAYPGLVLTVLDWRPQMPAEAVATAHDDPGGHRLVDYVARAVLRTLLFVASEGQRTNNPVAPAEA